jgi:large subunit ribosomal protein L25
MKLELKKRESGTKSALKMIRRKGDIPAIIYQNGKASLKVVVDGPTFSKHLREMTRGCISTVRFECILEGKKFSAIIKDISYHRTTYNVEHIDLQPIEDSTRIRINIPVLTEGADECPAITQGGQVKRVKRSIPVSIKAKHFPKAFNMSVKGLNLGGSVRVRDLPKIETMKVLMADHQVLMSVSK